MVRRRAPPLLVWMCLVTVSHKPSKSHVNHDRSTHGAPAAESAPASPLHALVAEAIAQLDALEAKLDLDIVVRPNDRAQMRALNRVSDTALGIASGIVSTSPERFADFTGIVPAAKYVATMTPLAQRVADFATHVQKSIQNQRSPAAEQTLALYAVAKGLGRLADHEQMREKVETLRAEIAPARSKRKQTKEEKALKRAEKARAKRVAKAMKVIAENSGPLASTVTATAAPAAPPAPVVADGAAHLPN